MEMTNDGVDLTEYKDGGVIKVIKKEGTGEDKPSAGTRVTVHYTGKLTDGTVFDSSHNHGEKFTFNLGEGQVIKAWDLCVASMKRGEKCEVTCAAKYAYGKRGSPPKIPPDATLIFEIELFYWEGQDISEDSDKGILKEILEKGTDQSTPNDGAEVEIRLVGKYDGKVFDERKVKFIVGEDVQLVPAINTTVKTMKNNEQCRILVKPKYGFGADGRVEFGVPADATIEYEITMMEFVRAKESWEMNDDERLKEGLSYKEKGTTCIIKAGDYRKAIKYYNKVHDFLAHHEAHENGSDEDKALIEQWNKTKLAAYLNLALCQNKLKEHADAIDNCNKALELDPVSEKALFRKGEAFFSELNYADAKEHFTKALQVNPNNKPAKIFLNKCSTHIKQLRKKEMATFKGMFDKFVKEDEKYEIKREVELQKERARAKAEKRSAEKANEAGDAATINVDKQNGHGDEEPVAMES